MEIGNYLKINEENVYLDKEVIDFLEEHKLHYNFEFHYVDIDQGRIFTI